MNDERRLDLGHHTFEADRCNEVVERAKVLLSKVAALPRNASPHLHARDGAGKLLRLCGATRAGHLLCTTPPELVRAAAHRPPVQPSKTV